MGFDDAGDGGGSQADGAQDAGKVVDIGRGIAVLNQAAGEYTDEGNLVDQTLDIGGFDPSEIVWVEFAGVEAVFEGIGITQLGAGTLFGGRG